MDWKEARYKLRKSIEQFGNMMIEMTNGKGPMPPTMIDPYNINNEKFSLEKRTLIVNMLCFSAVKDCSARHLDELLIGINTPDMLIRTSIADACGACGYAPAIPAIIRKFKDSRDKRELERLAFALTAMGESAVRELVDLLLDIYYREGNQVASNILWNFAVGALVNMGTDVVDWLLKFLHDEHPDRWWIAVMLCRQNFQVICSEKARDMWEDQANRSNQLFIQRLGQILRDS